MLCSLTVQLINSPKHHKLYKESARLKKTMFIVGLQYTGNKNYAYDRMSFSGGDNKKKLCRGTQYVAEYLLCTSKNNILTSTITILTVVDTNGKTD